MALAKVAANRLVESWSPPSPPPLPPQLPSLHLFQVTYRHLSWKKMRVVYTAALCPVKLTTRHLDVPHHTR